jgi:hypothetical protein
VIAKNQTRIKDHSPTIRGKIRHQRILSISWSRLHQDLPASGKTIFPYDCNDPESRVVGIPTRSDAPALPVYWKSVHYAKRGEV